MHTFFFLFLSATSGIAIAMYPSTRCEKVFTQLAASFVDTLAQSLAIALRTVILSATIYDLRFSVVIVDISLVIV